MKLRETLHNWGNIDVDVTTDEEIGDILVAIKYIDHGDEFLYVKTYSGEEYEYGYYLNRRDCFDDFDITKNSGESDERFIRRPIMFANMDSDECTEASDDVYRRVHGGQFGFMDWSDFMPKERYHAEVIFKMFLNTVKEIIDKGVYYNFEKYKELALEFIKVNELGQEAIDKLEEIKWNSKINGFDGIAGKREGHQQLYGDSVISVLYRGKNFDLDKITYKIASYDEWGSYTYTLSTKQFQ